MTFPEGRTPRIIRTDYSGLVFFIDPLLTEQWRRPRSKRRRIRKKWTARAGNHRPLSHFWMAGNKIYCHPQQYAAMRKELAIDVFPHVPLYTLA